MAVLKCKMCGGPLTVNQGQTTVQCLYCDSVQTVPSVDDDLKVMMFDRANDLRLRCDFDQALNVYQSIVTQFPNEAEAYWGLCLCKYGIEYVDDPVTRTKIPTCHRTQPQSIFSDNNFRQACELSPGLKWKYEDEASQIDSLQKKILEISNREEPYDIFICYKETDDLTGMRTDDSTTAQDIYTELVKNNYRVFFSRVSLRGKAGTEYEPYIYSALMSSKIMLVIGSRREYFEAVWLKNEWSRYLGMMQKGGKTIIPCFEKMTAVDIPVQLRNFQALDMSNKIFFSDLLTSIQRIIPKNKPQPQSYGNDGFGSGNSGTAGGFASKKELNFDDGVYVGAAIGNRPHGEGTRFFTNGNKYVGNWNMGSYHGQGTMTYNNGDSWSGEWNNGVPFNGRGKCYVTKGENNTTFCYEGELKQGKLCGIGKIYCNGNLTREGMFENGSLHGQGTAYISKYTCTGEFRNGKPWNAVGHYPLTSNPGLIYDGYWRDGVPNGRGTVNCTIGNNVKVQIEGTFVDGLNGDSQWTYSDGRKYVGQIKNGNINGKGIMYISQTERYEGEFLNGLYHGQGAYYYPEGYWTGEWKDGKRWKGSGLLFHVNAQGARTGKFYNGNMVNGVAAGKGVLRNEDGSRFTGEFFNDNYYNGTLYNAANQVIDTYVNGQSQALVNQQRYQQNQQRNQQIAEAAYDIWRILR